MYLVCEHATKINAYIVLTNCKTDRETDGAVFGKSDRIMNGKQQRRGCQSFDSGLSTMADAVLDNAELHQNLLRQLGEVDYAKIALPQAEERLTALQAQLAEQKKGLGKYARASKKEYDDWKRLSESVSSRAVARVKSAAGRASLEERIDKEEKEWLDALREVR